MDVPGADRVLERPARDGQEPDPDPERAPLVRRAFQDFATGRFTKHEVRKAVIALGLKTRRGQPVPSQTFDDMLRNRVYIGQVDVADYGVATRGDFEALGSSTACRTSRMAASRLLHRANEIIQIFRYAASCDVRLAADRERAQAFT